MKLAYSGLLLLVLTGMASAGPQSSVVQMRRQTPAPRIVRHRQHPASVRAQPRSVLPTSALVTIKRKPVNEAVALVSVSNKQSASFSSGCLVGNWGRERLPAASRRLWA